MHLRLIILFIIFASFPFYHFSRILYYKYKKYPKVVENAIILEEPYVKKLSLGKIGNAILSPESSQGKQFEITSPRLTKLHKGDSVTIVYYGEDYKNLCLLSERKSDDRFSLILLAFVALLLYIALFPN